MIGVGSNINNSAMSLRVAPSTSSRILDIPCKVCGDNSSGKHYNIFACDGCAGFFKRSIRKNRQYVCKAKSSGSCIVDKTHRNQCRACRLLKCQEAGMNKDAVQHERGPRNSTLKRQQLMLLNENGSRLIRTSPSSVLDLAISNAVAAPRFSTPINVNPHPPFIASPPTPAMPRMPLAFHMPVPLVLTELLNPTQICEEAARLLFFNVTWAKSVPSFNSLPLSDQLILLEESWRELFILGAAQYLAPLDLSPLIQSRMKSIPESEVREFQCTLAKIKQFNIDAQEFACLKAMILFKINEENRTGELTSVSESMSKSKSVRDLSRISAIQENTQLMLNQYVHAAYPLQPLRFGKLLLLLPTLKHISSGTIEELFFRNTIGNIPIVTIICNVYKSISNNDVL